jgi:hypothetical protein
MTLVGYKGLPQGSVLCPFLYNFIGSCADRFIPSVCGFFQYLVVYMAHKLFSVAHGLVQTACTSLNVFFSSMGLTISASKSEVMLFTRKHERPPTLVRVRSCVLPQTSFFKYLSIFFDAGLWWNWHAKYVRRRCLQRVNLLKSVAGVSCGAHPSCLILLHRGLIGSVLEYRFVLRIWQGHTCWVWKGFNTGHWGLH